MFSLIYKWAIFVAGAAGGLDILLISGNQVVSGNISFVNGIYLDGANIVTGLVDGVDIPALAAHAVYDTGNQNISGRFERGCGLANQFGVHKQKVVGSSLVMANVLCP